MCLRFDKEPIETKLTASTSADNKDLKNAINFQYIFIRSSAIAFPLVPRTFPAP